MTGAWPAAALATRGRAVTRVGICLGESLLALSPARRRALLGAIATAGIDHVCVGDHISCWPPGSASVSQLAPGRLVLGAGVGGEDRAEISNSGVAPSTRGRRLDETLAVLRALASGEPVDYQGEFFTLQAAAVLPAPCPPVPIVIGGRGPAAVARAARHGDGWLGIFCSARRFRQTRHDIATEADRIGRAVPSWYGMNVWCGLDPDERRAAGLLVSEMEPLYRLPQEKFEHVAPAGTPAQVADWLAPLAARARST